MRKILSALLIGTLTTSLFGLSALAADSNTSDTENVTPTIQSTPMSHEDIIAQYNQLVPETEQADITAIAANNNDEDAPIIVDVTPMDSKDILAQYEQEKTDENCSVDILTKGSSIPTSVYDLTDVTYTGTFNFQNYTYSNYLFTIPYGYLNVEISASTGSSSDKSYTLSLWEKGTFSNTRISGVDIDYDTKTKVTFPSISSSKKYFLKLEKGSTGTYAKGTFLVA